MELNHFKDKIFELLNEADNLNISDIEANDKSNTFTITLQNGKRFEVECRELHAQCCTSAKEKIKSYPYRVSDFPLVRIFFHQNLL